MTVASTRLPISARAPVRLEVVDTAGVDVCDPGAVVGEQSHQAPERAARASARAASQSGSAAGPRPGPGRRPCASCRRALQESQWLTDRHRPLALSVVGAFLFGFHLRPASGAWPSSATPRHDAARVARRKRRTYGLPSNWHPMNRSCIVAGIGRFVAGASGASRGLAPGSCSTASRLWGRKAERLNSPIKSRQDREAHEGHKRLDA